MTRKSKQYTESDEELDTIIINKRGCHIEYNSLPEQPNRRDYFEQLCNVYDKLEDYCYDQSLFLLDNGTFEDFCELVYQCVPETRPLNF